MIRKAIIVVLLLGAVLVIYGWAITVQNIPLADGSGYAHVIHRLRGFETIYLTDDNWLPSVGRFTFGSVLVVPFWIPVASLLVYPAIAFIRGPLLRWRRRRKGLCLKCGYNLTGNESGKCPECGSFIRKKSKEGSAQ